MSSAFRSAAVPTLRGRAFAVAFVAAIGGFLFGYDLAIIAGANVLLKQYFQLDEVQFGFATASAVLGCVLGPFVGGWLCDRVGRKWTLGISALLLALSAIGTALCDDLLTFNAFRILGGVGVGFCSVASPMYVAEIAPRHRRGALGLMYQIAVVVGSLVSGVVAWYFARTLPPDVSWRSMFGLETVFVLLFALLIIPMPESPRWLWRRGQSERARAVLTWVLGEERAADELHALEQATLERQHARGSFAELLGPSVRPALIVGLLLALFNNYTGWSGMALFLPSLFQSGGFDNLADAILQFVLAYAFLGAVTLVAMLLVDRVGRRKLWNVSSLMMAASMLLLGLVFHLEIRGYVVLAVVFLCAIPHALALGGLPWLMMSEIFPTRLRARGVATTTTFLWLTIFTSSMIFPPLVQLSQRTVGSAAGAFWLFAAICVGSYVFGKTLLPETSGRALEEVRVRAQPSEAGVARPAESGELIGKTSG